MSFWPVEPLKFGQVEETPAQVRVASEQTLKSLRDQILLKGMTEEVMKKDNDLSKITHWALGIAMGSILAMGGFYLYGLEKIPARSWQNRSFLILAAVSVTAMVVSFVASTMIIVRLDDRARKVDEEVERIKNYKKPAEAFGAHPGPNQWTPQNR